MPQPPDPNQNIEQLLSTLKIHNKDLDACFNDHVAVAHLLALISKQERIARKDELRRAERAERYDGCLATHILDRMSEQTPPTPNGDEQGGLEKSEEAKSE